MVRFDIISAVPGLLDSPFSHSILFRAQEKGLAEVHVHNLRDYGQGSYNQIDDYQYGGGAGMVMMPAPLFQCIEDLKKERPYDEVIFLTPDGNLYDQSTANRLSLKGNVILICGHYKGIDQRIRDHLVTMEISIGDYVLSGGELAAAVIVDSVIRLIPGVLGDETSALFDSFQDHMLAPPVYTRPESFNGWQVPEILLSGHDAKIAEWRHQKAIERTKQLRPDLLDDSDTD
jgi:tRNA (guanine37-N1)-methyltransferase